MRISSKGRYGLASMIYMADNSNNHDCITIIRISEQLGISKIYLEQVFSLLKKAGLVISVKGAQGGYKLSKDPDKITGYDVLYAAEQMLFEKTEESVSDNAKYIEKTMQDLVFSELDFVIEEKLKKITLSNLVSECNKYKNSNSLMYYI